MLICEKKNLYIHTFLSNNALFSLQLCDWVVEGGCSFYCPCTKSYRGSCNPVDYFAEYTIASHQKHVNQTNIEDVKQLTKGELSIIDVWLACGRGGWGVS